MVRAAGVASIVVFLAFLAQCWHPVWGFTAFLQLDASSDRMKIAAFHRYPVYVYRDTGGYDGQYYAQLAYDPALRHPETARAMDNPAYRARRILPAAVAWLLGLGSPARIVYAYSILNIVAWMALAAILWRLLPVRDFRSCLAWFGVLFSTGAIGSVRLALTDLVGLSLLAGAMLAVDRGRSGTAGALTAGAALARETSLLALVGLVRRPWRSAANVRLTAIGVVPFAAWLVYVRWALGSGDAGWSNMTGPFVGLVEKLSVDLSALRNLGDPWLAWTTLAATVGLIVQALYVTTRPRPADGWWRLGAAYTLLMISLNTPVWEGHPGAATRVLLPMTLAFNVLAIRHRAALAWLVAGNLAVLNGYLVMRDVPRDGHELVADHVDAAAVIVRTDDRWSTVEHHWRRTTAWSSGRGTLAVETWPHDNRALALYGSLRSRRPLVLTVAQDGVVLWRNTIFERPIDVVLPCQVRNGTARIEFAASSPGGGLEANDANGSSAFAVDDLRAGPIPSK